MHVLGRCAVGYTRAMYRGFFVVCLVAASCGGPAEERAPCEPGDPRGESVRGTAPASWECLCQATFTADYAVPDTALTLRAGDSYVMGAGPIERIYYLGDDGELIVDFDIEPDAPITTTCSWSSFGGEQGEGRLVVFADVELFADAELTQPACQLSAGTLLPLEGGWGNFLAGVDVRGFESEGLVETCGVDTVYAAGDSVMFEGQFALHPPIADVAVRP